MIVGLAYPDTPAWPKWDWIARAAEAIGWKVLTIRSIEDLEAADEVCDLILFCQRGAGLHPGAVMKSAGDRRSKWVQWNFNLHAVTDLPLASQNAFATPDGRPTMFLKMMQVMDLVLVKEPSMLDEYKKLGVNAQFLEQACPSWMPACEYREFPEFDVLFFGNSGYTQRRRDITSLLTEGFTVAWAGQPGDGLPPGCLPLYPTPAEKLPGCTSRASVVLAVDMRNDLAGYHSDRTWMALGMGACLLRRRFPEMPKGLEDHCMVYSDAAEMFSHLTRARADRQMRERMGTAARAWVLAEHTYERRLQQLTEMIQCNDRQGPAERVGAADASA